MLRAFFYDRGSLGKQKPKHPVIIFNDEYFEIELRDLDGGKFNTGKTLQQSGESVETLYMRLIKVADAEGEITLFKSSTEFLNYMGKHGYEIVAQKRVKYHTEYTFKRKT